MCSCGGTCINCNPLSIGGNAKPSVANSYATISEIQLKADHLIRLNRWLRNPADDELSLLSIKLSIDLLRPVIEAQKALVIAELKELAAKL